MPDAPAGPAPSLYDVLAPVYDRWQRCDGMTPFAQLALAKLLPVLGRYVRGNTPAAPRSFVDLGCGTGDLLLGLARARPHWRLAGIDGSAGMLAVARAKPGAACVEWAQSALDALIVPAPRFDAAGCFYDTLNHLPDVAALRAAFRDVAAALVPGGLFLFDVTNQVGFESWWGSHRVWHGRDWCVDVTTHYDRDRRLGHADTLIQNRGEETRATLTERCFTEGEVRAALAAAGLNVVSDEPWSPFDTDAEGKTWWISVKSS